MIQILTHIIDVVKGKTTLTKMRSPKWESFRKEWLTTNNCCAVCGNTKNLEVHHIKPFKDFPELELDKNNLITLCEKTTLIGNCKINCHLQIGHDGNFKFYNDTLNSEIIEINRFKENVHFKINEYVKERNLLRKEKYKSK